MLNKINNSMVETYKHSKEELVNIDENDKIFEDFLENNYNNILNETSDEFLVDSNFLIEYLKNRGYSLIESDYFKNNNNYNNFSLNQYEQTISSLNMYSVFKKTGIVENDNNLKYAFSLPGYPGEVWGPYRKQFTKSDLLPGQVFTPPESVDGVPILCRCRDIPTYMRDPRGGRMLQGFGAVTLGKSMPACWDDTESIWNTFGGMYYYLKIREPGFFAFAASKDGLLGVAKGIATGPVGPVPLALGAYFLTRPKKAAGGGTRRGKAAKTKATRKMNRLKSRHNK
jgi:hypothetical protein